MKVKIVDVIGRFLKENMHIMEVLHPPRGNANGQQVRSDYAGSDPKCGPEDSVYAFYLKRQGKTDAEIAELNTDEARREHFKNMAGIDGVASYEEFIDHIKEKTAGSGEDISIHRWAPNLFKIMDLNGDGSLTYEETVATRCKAFIFVVKHNKTPGESNRARGQENGPLYPGLYRHEGNANGQQVRSDYAGSDPKCGPEDSIYAFYLKQQGKTDAEIAELDTDEATREHFKNMAGIDGVVSYEEFIDHIKENEDISIHSWAPNVFKIVDLNGDGSITYEEIVATRCKAFIFVVKHNKTPGESNRARGQENGHRPFLPYLHEGTANGQQVRSDYAGSDPKCGPEDSAHALYLKQQGKTDAEIAELDTDEARRERFKNIAGIDGVVSYEEFIDDIKRRTAGSGKDRSIQTWEPNLFKLMDLNGDGSQTYEEVLATRCKAFIFVVNLNKTTAYIGESNRNFWNGYRPYEQYFEPYGPPHRYRPYERSFNSYGPPYPGLYRHEGFLNANHNDVNLNGRVMKIDCSTQSKTRQFGPAGKCICWCGDTSFSKEKDMLKKKLIDFIKSI